ncbi:MAG: NADP-dependent malic enzyme, partial [Deltaproteobacteria bacterium]|nr:NADP-dependent malic enzyme [Deltaproteobacteria bacterium]
PKSHLSFAEQLLEAEIGNIHFHAAGGVLRMAAPNLHAFEQGLSLSLSHTESFIHPTRSQEGTDPQFAYATAARNIPDSVKSRATIEEIMRAPLLMANHGDRNGNDRRKGSRSHTPTTNINAAATPPSSAEPLPEVSRYHLPDTDYFRPMRQGMSLAQLSGYAAAERRAQEIGTNLQYTLSAPMNGPQEYSPYGSGLVERIRENVRRANDFTGKWERALVASPGTAILGLGAAAIDSNFHLYARAADAIMEGKSKFFLTTAGVRTDPICIETHFSPRELTELRSMEARKAAEHARVLRAEKFGQTVLNLANNYGFINIEDAAGRDLPIIFGMLESLRGQTAIWSDDMQGTGVITAAGMLNWAEITGRRMSDIRGVIFGAGAGSMGVYRELINHGMRPENILTTDSRGAVHEGREDIASDPYKMEMRQGIPANTNVENFAGGADFIINLGVTETFAGNLEWTRRLVMSLAQDPLVGPMTNPEPGITPQMLRSWRSDGIFASGNQEFENVFNNFTAFGYIGAGALMARAGEVNAPMTVAAARGIAAVAKLGPPAEMITQLPPERRQFGRHWLVPRSSDLRLIDAEAGAVAWAAAESGVSTLLGASPSSDQLSDFRRHLNNQLRVRREFVAELRSRIEDQGKRHYFRAATDRYHPFTLNGTQHPVYNLVPEINLNTLESLNRAFGTNSSTLNDARTSSGEIIHFQWTHLLTNLQTSAEQHPALREELRIITLIIPICPELGFALALRAHEAKLGPKGRQSIFHEERVRNMVLEMIPEAREEIETLIKP